MSLSAARWHVIAESNFQWEREALDWLRAHLPDRDPWHVWTNFEFIDDEGKVNEVDALVLSPAGLFLVEIKSRPGTLAGDAHSWTWTTDGRDRTADNPLILANRKAKRLASLLRRQSAVVKAKIRLPYLEPAVFLSAPDLKVRLQGLARTGAYQHGRPGAADDDGIVGALTRGITATSVHQAAHAPVDGHHARIIGKAIIEAGIRPSSKHRQVGDYRLDRLLTEGEGYQDWHAHHVSMETIQRRVRIYTIAGASSPEARDSRVRQARREFEVLEGIDHPGILKVLDYKDTELGPALVFDHDPKALRLDHLLRDHGARLTITQRLQLVRDIAETLKHAHARQLYHRALGPQSILVQGIETATPRPRLMNWQTAARQADAAAGASRTAAHHTSGTRHVEDYVEDLGHVYLAPETARADPAHGASLDVFSLGCIAYHVFSGQPPAENALALLDKLRIGQGLRLSDVMDGCGARQQELVQFATSPDVFTRYGSMGEFLAELDLVEDELTTPDPETTVDPGSASSGDRLEGGFTVVRRLGRGSSADALLVRPDDSDDELVLKVAIDAGHNDRLAAEGEVLAALHHANIVGYQRKLQIAGRTALLIRAAGERNLATVLREDGRLSLDLLQRFGEELLDAVNHLEGQGIAHRDIKPENIGIHRSRTGKLQLVLFDFSLSRTPADNISAGTVPYLDPFLSLRRPARWDLSAERFAAAVTLYEMATTRTPTWGDGHTAPALQDAEVTLQTDVFDPALRQGLGDFFSRALRRDFRQRFDNAEDMLRAWRALFAQAQAAPAQPATGLAAIAATATPATTMAELGFSLDAQAVLDRMAIHNARELLAVDRVRFRYLRGVGDKIRKEIRLLAKELARLRPDLSGGHGTLHDAPDSSPAADTLSINELAGLLLPRRPAGDDRPEEAALAHYLGLGTDLDAGTEAGTDALADGTWPTLGDAALAAQVDRAALAACLVKARERWLKTTAFTDLRGQLADLLHRHGQVMTVREAALALLSLRGCAAQDEAERLRQASAVVRAAAEAEAHLDAPRFQAHEHPRLPLLATGPDWASYARQLGVAADACALADPLLPPHRVVDMLEAITPPAAGPGLTAAPDALASPPAPTLPTHRLLRLATAASQRAALSSRHEIYPRGMPAVQALRQSLNALAGAQLSVAALQGRVHGRYPEALPLPGRPALDRLLDEAGAPLVWDPLLADGGAYRPHLLGDAATAGNTTRFSRHATRLGSGDAQASADALTTGALITDALNTEAHLQRSLRQGGLLALNVEPRLARHAEVALLHRFGTADESLGATPLQRLSVDALLLRELRAQATAARIDWAVVLRADAAEPGSRDWTNLLRLVQRTLPALRQALLHSPAPLLVVHAGLLARYGLMDLVSALEQHAGRLGHTPSAWLLLPSHQPGVAQMGPHTVPLVNASAIVSLGREWIENRHRAASDQPA